MRPQKYILKKGLLDIEPPSCLDSFRKLTILPFLDPPIPVIISQALLIHNPVAGRSSARSLADIVKLQLSSRGLPYTQFQTSLERNPFEDFQIREGTLFVVMGGDGTVNLVLSQLDRAIKAECAIYLHIVPMGTGNDLFYSTADRYSPKKLVQFADARKLDMGEVRFVNALTQKQERRLFCTQIGLGMSVEVNRLADDMRRVGALRYKLALYLSFFRNVDVDCELDIDGVKVVSGFIRLLQIQNSPKVGGGIKIAPFAQMDDGLLDIVIGHTDSRLTFLRVARKAGSGFHVYENEVNYYRGERIAIRSKGQIQFMVDGQMLRADGSLQIGLVRDRFFLV